MKTGFLLCIPLLAASAVFVDLGKPLKDSLAGPGWTFYAEAPIRYNPVVWQDRLYDCLDRDGRVLWKFFAGPGNREMLMGGRLVSAWRISTRPVIAQSRIYVTAGTSPMMGVYVYALDARTGSVVWVNDNSNDHWQDEIGPRTPGVRSTFVFKS